MFSLPCSFEIVAYLEWLIEIEYGKLKYEIKDLLLVDFWQNKHLKPKSLACLVKWTKLYPLTGKSCGVFVYSALLVALFSGVQLGFGLMSCTGFIMMSCLVDRLSFVFCCNQELR